MLVLFWVNVSSNSARFALTSIAQAQSDSSPVIATVTPEFVQMSASREVVIKGQNFTPQSLITLEGLVIKDLEVVSANEIHLRIPVDVAPGNSTISVLTERGIAQHSVGVLSKPAADLSVGQVTTVAGGLVFFGDGGPAVDATLITPTKAALDANNNLYVIDSNGQRVRRVDAATGIATTAVGGGFSLADGELATTALIKPTCLAFDAAGNLYVGDFLTSTVRRVDAVTHKIRTVAGSASGSFSGDNGPAINAGFGDAPTDIAIDAAGNLFIAANHRVRRVDAATGIITTVAGNGLLVTSGDGGLAINAATPAISGITLDAAGNLFIVTDRRVRRVDAQSRSISTVAGNGDINLDFDNRDGKPATSISLFADHDSDVVVDQNGNIFVAEFFFGRVVRIDKQSGLISTVRPSAITGDLACEELLLSGGLALDAANQQLYISEIGSRVRKVDLTTSVSTNVIGNKKSNLRNDEGQLAVKAALGKPRKIAIDAQGNTYIADPVNGFIRKIDAATGTISTVAGNGVRLCEGKDSTGKPALQTAINPGAVAVDRNGNIFFSNDDQVFRIDANTKIVTLYAGQPRGRDEDGDEIDIFSGDGGPATEALLAGVTSLAVNDNGDLFIGAIRFFSDGRVRKVDAATGIISSIAGNGASSGGDGGPANQAGVLPYDIALDKQGNLLLVNISSDLKITIRRIEAGSNTITTIAGSGEVGQFSGEGGPAAAANLGIVQSVTADQAGNIYLGAVSFSEGEVTPGPTPRGRTRVWRIDAETKLITVAIDSVQTIYSGDGTSDATLAGYNDNGIIDVETDPLGNLLILNTNEGSVAALRLLRMENRNISNGLEISGINYKKPTLSITGKGFGDSGAQVRINGADLSSLIKTASDSSLSLKGSRKKLNLKKGLNQLTVTNSQGNVATFSF